MRWVLQLFAILLFITPALFPPGICLCWPLAIALLALDRSLANQAKAIEKQDALSRQLAAQAAPVQDKRHWRDVEQYIDPLCGVYRIRADDRVFVDARGGLVRHESFDALRVEDELAIRTVWPDGEDDFVIGVFFDGKMVGVLPAQLEPKVRPILQDKKTDVMISARVHHIDREARDPVVLGYFNFVLPQAVSAAKDKPSPTVIDELAVSLARVWDKHPTAVIITGAVAFMSMCGIGAWLAVDRWM